MHPRLKTFIQYVIILGVTILLTWFSLRSLTLTDGRTGYADKWNFIVQTWTRANKGWLMLTAMLVMTSHIIRTERWRMLIKSSGHEARRSSGFLSLMVGYLVNLVIPRGGEVSRCYNLYKLDKTPVEISFGTVVIERIVDLLCLILLLILAFSVESEKLFRFINTLPINFGASKLSALGFAAGAFICLVLIFILVLKKNKKFSAFVIKLWEGFKDGLLSVFKLKQKGLFVVYSVSIWILYFIMSYTVILAFEETRDLSITAVLSLFAIGAIAMAAPLPGGTGSYHVLVPQGLIFLYGLPPADAVAFTFVFHGWQTAIVIVAGAISLLLTSILIKRKQEVKQKH